MTEILVTRISWFGTFAVHSKGFETWASYQRAIADLDPFQSGEYSTWPAWYVGTQIARVLSTLDARR